VIPDHRLDGEGPLLVLPSSLGTTEELWADQVPVLAGRFRLLRYALRGHGGSPAPPGPYSVEALGHDALQVLDGLGVERASFCGLSLGGAVAMWIAAAAPERVDRLVLACTSARFEPLAGWRERAATVRVHGVAAVADLALERWFTPRLRAERPDVVARFRAGLCATAVEGYAGCCEALAGWSFGDRLGAIAAPTLVIAGAEDRVCPLADLQALAAGIAGARLEVLAGTGHLANVEAPPAFTGALLAHLRGDSGGRKEVA
jgi:3-oxoadipate enol-lactonase